MELKITGLHELIDALQHLPAHLNEITSGIVIAAGEGAETALRQVYPPGSMHTSGSSLRDGIKLDILKSESGTVAKLRSTSPAAHLWEYGTAVRRTQAGWNRGSEAAHPDAGVISIARRHRRQMYREIADVLRGEGFVVVVDV